MDEPQLPIGNHQPRAVLAASIDRLHRLRDVAQDQDMDMAQELTAILAMIEHVLEAWSGVDEEHAVESTALEDVAYGQRPTLTIRFRNGRTYEYYGVPEQLYTGLIAADSKGRFFNAHIRNRFPYQQIEAASTET